jgi:phosphoribosylamine---glycine ligase
LLWAAAAGKLPGAPLPQPSGTRVGVVLASGGYPGPMTTGHAIAGIDAAEELDGVLVFQAGTRVRQGTRLRQGYGGQANAEVLDGGQAQDEVVTAGGRVLTVVGEGETLPAARDRAYTAAARISFEGMHFRRDIAAKYV